MARLVELGEVMPVATDSGLGLREGGCLLVMVEGVTQDSVQQGQCWCWLGQQKVVSGASVQGLGGDIGLIDRYQGDYWRLVTRRQPGEDINRRWLMYDQQGIICCRRKLLTRCCRCVDPMELPPLGPQGSGHSRRTMCWRAQK